MPVLHDKLYDIKTDKEVFDTANTENNYETEKDLNPSLSLPNNE